MLLNGIFHLFIKKINALVKDDNNHSLIIIGTFISLMTLFKNLRNMVNHLEIIYNFWDIHAPVIVPSKRNVLALPFEFWIANRPTCDFINRLLTKKKQYFNQIILEMNLKIKMLIII